jgi:hypothetical protein
MPKIMYVPKRFNKQSLDIIEKANDIIEEYQNDGLELTLRQLYYQFVARDIFPEDRKWKWTGSKWIRDLNGTKNADPNYIWLGSVINDGRLAGLIDWNAIVDRTRNMHQNSHWDNGGEILRTAATSFGVDKWEGQATRAECWIEKDALLGVIEQPCKEEDIPYFSCRGYTSQSEMWVAAQRLRKWIEEGCNVIVFHLGDHDPSGVDMSRDIQDRLNLLSNDAGIEVQRIALTMDQIDKYNPPPNPAKLTDSRCEDYISKYGNSSWELDALEPRVMRDLIKESIESIRDQDLWDEKVAYEEEEKEKLLKIADSWENNEK